MLKYTQPVKYFPLKLVEYMFANSKIILKLLQYEMRLHFARSVFIANFSLLKTRNFLARAWIALHSQLLHYHAYLEEEGRRAYISWMLVNLHQTVNNNNRDACCCWIASPWIFLNVANLFVLSDLEVEFHIPFESSRKPVTNAFSMYELMLLGFHMYNIFRSTTCYWSESAGKASNLHLNLKTSNQCPNFISW